MFEVNHKLLENIESQLNCKIKSCNPLGNGEHNLNFLLESNKGKFVLRIYSNNQFNHSKNEYQILSKLDGRYAPKVHLYDNSKSHIEYDYMVQEFIKGVTLKKFLDSDMTKVALILKEIHKIKDNSKDRTEKGLISQWTKNNFLQKSKLLGDELHNILKQIYMTVLRESELIKPLIHNYKRIHLIHDDLIPENIIRTKEDNLIFVDWEFATFDYFFLEFGCITAEYNLGKKQENILLKEYGFGLKPDERKILHVVKINRILSLIGWLIERIVAINQGKKIFVNENITKYQSLLEKERDHINKLLSSKP